MWVEYKDLMEVWGPKRSLDKDEYFTKATQRRFSLREIHQATSHMMGKRNRKFKVLLRSQTGMKIRAVCGIYYKL